jgi:hypothetical protein
MIKSNIKVNCDNNLNTEKVVNFIILLIWINILNKYVWTVMNATYQGVRKQGVHIWIEATPFETSLSNWAKMNMEKVAPGEGDRLPF